MLRIFRITWALYMTTMWVRILVSYDFLFGGRSLEKSTVAESLTNALLLKLFWLPDTVYVVVAILGVCSGIAIGILEVRKIQGPTLQVCFFVGWLSLSLFFCVIPEFEVFISTISGGLPFSIYS